MALEFSKMHGLGNDFVVIDGVSRSITLPPEAVRRLADRRTGIGCDQVLVAEPAGRNDADFFLRIYNSDGSAAEQCGNGARCLGLFLHRKGLTERRKLAIETVRGLMTVRLDEDDQVTVDMGPPILDPAGIPFEAPVRATVYTLEVEGQSYEIGAVSMGNPHAVLRVANVAAAAVERLGPAIESHGRFPRRVNVGFMEVVARNHIRLRVYERGAGETRACGSGACAAVVAGRLQELLDAEVRVSLPGGDLVVSWTGDSQPVMMKGPATHVFEGHIEL